MATKTKSKPKAQARVQQLLQPMIQNVQFDILDLGKLTAAGVAAQEAGEDVEAALRAAVARYRKN